MATQSISKNIHIKDKKLCENLVHAMEQAKKKPSKKVRISKRCSDVKKEKIKSFFGDN